MVNINGVTYSGNSVVVKNNKIYIDGKEVNPADSKEYIISVHGDYATVSTESGEVTVNGNNTNSVNTMSGDVFVHGDVLENVSTMSGDVRVKGSISGKVSTMSGDITRV